MYQCIRICPTEIGKKILFETHIMKRNNAISVFFEVRQNIRSEKKDFPSFRFQAKITKLKRSAAKITKLKRSEAKQSEKFETKRSEKIDLNFLSEQAKHM
jgi:hypothetical protein